MPSNIALNLINFTGLPDGTGNQSAWQPIGIALHEHKVGVTLIAANGTRNRVERNVTKRSWDITWEIVNLATIQTLRTIQRLMTTFVFTDLEGASFVVQTEDDDFTTEFLFIDRAGVRYYRAALTVYQA